jgi:hypothetical protein
MIKLFRDLNSYNFIILIILLYVLRIGLFINTPIDINTGFSFFGQRILIKDVNTPLVSPLTNITLAGLVVFIQALLFNRIVNIYNVLGKSTLLPALIYVVASSVFTPFLFLSPPLVCNFFILFIVYRILSSQKNQNLISTMFDLGMLTAIGTIFYFPFIVMILILFIALIIFRPFNWREWVAVLIGYIVIVFLLGVYYLWNDSLGSFYAIWRPLVSNVPVFIRINVQDYIVLLPITVTLILGFIQLRENFFRSYIQVRKTFQLLFFVVLITIMSFYLNPAYRINHFHLCVIPVSILMAYYFLHATKRWFYESLFLLITGFIIYFQFV